LFIFGALVMVFWYGGTLIVNGEITAGKLTTYIMYAVYMSASMVEIGMHYTSLKELTGASKRIFEIMDEEPDLEDSGHLSIQDLATKDIEFKSVSFSYPQQREAAVSELSFLVREGETVAFVGASGSGKSTLFKLLLRFYDIQSGAITIGGKDIKDFKLAEIRQLFGLVSQDTHLFSGTVHENVAYATERSVEDVEHAIAYSGAQEFVNRLPNGIYEAIGTGGVELSGGQKQRLSIARAYFAAPEIFLLDEATSALDADSEKYFQESLEMRKYKKTTLIIAHRMSTIRSADKIVVLDKGEIVDIGSHDVLIEKSEIYRRYCTLQSMLPKAGLELVS
jgi:ABC-type multidrug transport system fused ATPase/permease subunit